MNHASLKVHRAAERARWLAELAAALDVAASLAVGLRDQYGDSPEATLMRERIVTLRSEVDSLRRGRSTPRDETGPNWM